MPKRAPLQTGRRARALTAKEGPVAPLNKPLDPNLPPDHLPSWPIMIFHAAVDQTAR
jgi:hypothetical protein